MGRGADGRAWGGAGPGACGDPRRPHHGALRATRLGRLSVLCPARPRDPGTPSTPRRSTGGCPGGQEHRPRLLPDGPTPDRRRIDAELVLEVVAALGAGPSGTRQWRDSVRQVLRPTPSAPTVLVHRDLPDPTVHLACSQGRGGCRGRLVLTAGKKRLATGTCSLEHGSRATTARRLLGSRAKVKVLVVAKPRTGAHVKRHLQLRR